MGKLALPELIVLVSMALLMVLVLGRIFVQAGYSRWLALALFVPVVNVIVVVWFAFAKWPIRAELDRLRQNAPAR